MSSSAELLRKLSILSRSYAYLNEEPGVRKNAFNRIEVNWGAGECTAEKNRRRNISNKHWAKMVLHSVHVSWQYAAEWDVMSRKTERCDYSISESCGGWI